MAPKYQSRRVGSPSPSVDAGAEGPAAAFVEAMGPGIAEAPGRMQRVWEQVERTDARPFDGDHLTDLVASGPERYHPSLRR